jgi:hypothetical protein
MIFKNHNNLSCDCNLTFQEFETLERFSSRDSFF